MTNKPEGADPMPIYWFETEEVDEPACFEPEPPNNTPPGLQRIAPIPSTARLGMPR
jgi:hypothetical protein